ncbi:MAG: methylenetetrahydrofolate reductase [NAD(P)H] [Nitrospinae bacterium]|nr:methylenetetrahydrofolate reductase [NAD(P)H] [Nitrospinota bacterium]
MRIAELLHEKKGQFLSLEFFPPKEREAWGDFFKVVEKLKSTNPLFVSVTYGAGGGTQSNTLDIVDKIKNQYGMEPMAHLTCVGASDAFLADFLNKLSAARIDNVLALRGDPPRGDGAFKPTNQSFTHADDLVRFIRNGFTRFGVGVAAYPETHPEAVSAEDDLHQLKNKLDCGGDFAVTQLFFDNDLYWKFVERARSAGITKPIIPGVLPIINLGTIKKIASLCGATLPPSLLAELEKAGENEGQDAVAEIGTAHAISQAKELLKQGAPGVHLYTLNRAETCLKIAKECF